MVLAASWRVKPWTDMAPISGIWMVPPAGIWYCPLSWGTSKISIRMLSPPPKVYTPCEPGGSVTVGFSGIDKKGDGAVVLDGCAGDKKGAGAVVLDGWGGGAGGISGALVGGAILGN